MTSHLQSQGLTVKNVGDNNAFVSAVGSASQIEKAFSTQLGLYKAGDAVKRAPINDAIMPSVMGGRVSTVMGLVSPTKYGPHSVAQHHGAITRNSAKAMVEAKNPHPHAAAGPDTCSEWYGQVPTPSTRRTRATAR